jgi:hypothetical protein
MEFRLSLESLALFKESEVPMPMTAKQFLDWAASQPPRTGYEDMDLNRYDGFPEAHGTPGAGGMQRNWSAAISEDDLASSQQ